MIDPILSRIQREREATYGISVDFVIELEKDAEAGMCEDGMCGFGENMIT